MSRIVKLLQHRFYRPLVKAYLRKPRSYAYKGIRIMVHPGIFHPGLFYSTRFLLDELEKENLLNESLLELGCGSGLIALYAAKRGASVTASDINPLAIEKLEKNRDANRIPAEQLELVCSDLFAHLEPRRFNRIIINPPYYKSDPLTMDQRAWYCGRNGEYFTGLFEGIVPFLHENCRAWMVLSEDCDLSFIKQEAYKNKLRLEEIKRRSRMREVNFIFQVKLTSS